MNTGPIEYTPWAVAHAARSNVVPWREFETAADWLQAMAGRPGRLRARQFLVVPPDGRTWISVRPQHDKPDTVATTAGTFEVAEPQKAVHEAHIRPSSSFAFWVGSVADDGSLGPALRVDVARVPDWQIERITKFAGDQTDYVTADCLAAELAKTIVHTIGSDRLHALRSIVLSRAQGAGWDLTAHFAPNWLHDEDAKWIAAFEQRFEPLGVRCSTSAE